MIAKAPYLAIAACVLLAAAFYFLAWQPKDDEQTALEDETAELERQASSLRNEIAALEEIKANEVQIRATIAKIGEYVPEGPAQAEVMRQLQDAADAAGVTVESMQFGEPQRVEGAPDTGEPGTVLASIDSSFDLEGEYFQIVDFMRRIEVDVPRAVLIQQLSLSEGGEEGFPTLAGSWNGDLFGLVPTGEALAPGEGDVDDDPAEGEDGNGDEAEGDDGEGDDGLDEADPDEELQEAAG